MTAKQRRREYVGHGIVWSVADRLRGDDPIPTYLRKQVRAINDVLAGRPVGQWRLERLERLFSEIATESLRLSGSPGCRVVRLS